MWNNFFGRTLSVALLLLFAFLLGTYTTYFCDYSPWQEYTTDNRYDYADKAETKYRDESSKVTDTKTRWAEVVLRHLRIPVDETWGSHNIVLLASLYATRGPILELGSGFYSTPLIHNVAAEMERYVLTAEAYGEWLRQFLVLSSPDHEFAYVQQKENFVVPSDLPPPALTYQDWDTVGLDRQWSVTFVDRAPAAGRVDDVIRLRNVSRIFVVHDTNPEWHHAERLKAVGDTFPYKVHFDKAMARKRVISTDAWSVKDKKTIGKIEELVCWTWEIIQFDPLPLNQTEC